MTGVLIMHQGTLLHVSASKDMDMDSFGLTRLWKLLGTLRLTPTWFQRHVLHSAAASCLAAVASAVSESLVFSRLHLFKGHIWLDPCLLVWPVGCKQRAKALLPRHCTAVVCYCCYNAGWSMIGLMWWTTFSHGIKLFFWELAVENKEEKLIVNILLH